MTTRDDLVDKATAWDAISAKNAELRSALEARDAENARLTKLIDSYEQDVLGLMKERGEAQSRITSLERQLAEETERCARVTDSIAENAVQTGSKWIGHQAIPKTMTDERLRELADKAQAAYDAMTPSEKLRQDYEQRRSFMRGMCPWASDYETHCSNVDRIMPPASTLTDAEIGLALIGHYTGQPVALAQHKEK